MRATVDPRFTARRIEVRESWARRRLRRLVLAVSLVLVVGIGYAVLQSPWLAVEHVIVDGASRTDVAAALERSGVTTGVATVAVRPAAIEEALRSDPWVADARVHVTWPGTVEVAVIERTPAAWGRTSEGWVLIAHDGVIVSVDKPEEGAPLLLTTLGDKSIGDMIDDPQLAAGVTLLGLLPARHAVGASVDIGAQGIEATIDGHHVLFGSDRDIADKVATLVAMFDTESLAPGAMVNLVSPKRPGVTNLQVVVEAEPKEVSSTEDSG